MSFTIGYGSSFSSSPDGVSYTPYGGITDISGPNIDVKDVDTSNMGMGNRFKLYIPGLADGGEVELQIIFDKSVQAALLALLFSNLYFKVQFSDLNITESTWVFQGYIKGFKNALPLEDKCMITATFKVSGQPTFTAGT